MYRAGHSDRTAAPTRETAHDRLFILDVGAGRIVSMNVDGSQRKVLVTACRHPDGVAVDVEAGHIYWTNMGNPSLNDGSIERVDIDGGSRRTIIPEGHTYTPKQIHLDKESGKLYWCDREGMRVMRSNIDGSAVEVLVETGRGDADRKDATKWCVGICVDAKTGHFYWTQKGPDDGGLGRILRANVVMPDGQTPASRRDIEVVFDGLPEPIDLELDPERRLLYWTDRGDPPRGNTVNRAPIDGSPGAVTPEILVDHLMEGIGLALDLRGNRMYVTDLAGSIYSAKLDGADKHVILPVQGNLSGIAFAKLSTKES
jgi:hypothetical protein